MDFVSTRRLIAGLVAAAAAVVGGAATPAQAVVPGGVIVIDDVKVDNVPPGVPTDLVATVRMNGPVDHPVTIAYRTSDGTATANQDYRPVSATLTIPAGQTTATIPLRVTSDADPIHTEHFFVNLDSASGGKLADPQAVITIVDCTTSCEA